MKIFKNPESAKTVVCAASITALFTVVCFYAVGGIAAFFVFACSASVTAMFCVLNERRYKSLEKMCSDIDSILHGKDLSIISEFREGELSVLQSEITKMTVRLRESADILKKDKLFLTDSIADISHQLRTPLTSMNLMLSMISDQSLDPEKRKRLIYELRRLVTRIDWLIETLLKLSKIDAGTARFEQKSVYVRDILQSAVQPLSAAMDIRCQETVYTVGDERITADPGWCAEAISNIIKNCMDHNPDGGKIFITVSRTAIFTQITVEDEGSGIDPEDLPHVFERFYKGKNDSGLGFGIGLHLARTVINEQNGTLKAENRAEGGARFVIRFYYGTV